MEMRDNGYHPSTIEPKWQQAWARDGVFTVKADPKKPKYYVLDMFPYPSGAGLHMGHPLGYTASDIYSRYMRLKGYNVLHPMGYDSFGLPAEQYAIKTGQPPAITTEQNVKHYGEQLRLLGFSYDWGREFCTSDPEYYHWTQWVFLKLYAHYYDTALGKAQPIELLRTHIEKHGTEGLNAYSQEPIHITAEQWGKLSTLEQEDILSQYRLAYRAETLVNWCEELGTVLANDEVKEGLSVRGGYPVVQRRMQQWCLRVRAYAERLLEGLDTLEWSDALKSMQRNWIGRSEGALVRFKTLSNKQGNSHVIEVFTTRPDTIYGVSFMVLAPEHPLALHIASLEQHDEVEQYIEATSRRNERERMADVGRVSGVFTGAYALHPLSGEKVPIWLGDYVLGGYGTGAIMAVPAHDSRDFAFARHFNLPIPVVVAPAPFRAEATYSSEGWTEAFESNDGVSVNSGSLTGLSTLDAKQKAIELLKKAGVGEAQISYRLRDAIFSRQRYWGEPIPICYHKGVSVPFPEDKLPLTLPEITRYQPSKSGEPPLAQVKDWVTSEGYPIETSTMPGFAGSSAYYLRFMDPHNGKALVSPEANRYWRNVDLYIGGAEHATGHLIYSRFWNKFLYDLGLVCEEEPFKRLINQGMIQGRSNFIYRIKGENRYVTLELMDQYDTTPIHVDVNLVRDDILDTEALRLSSPEYTEAEFITNAQGEYRCGWAIEKMSKSMFNVVNPDRVVEKYGADTLRMYLMFLGPLEDSKPWDTHGIDGVLRFLRRLWQYVTKHDVIDEKPTEQELRALHRAIRQVEDGINRFSFNLCVSGFMVLLNELQATDRVVRCVIEPFLTMLSPFAPHITEELWEYIGNSPYICNGQWPTLNEDYLVESTYQCPISFNGKTRLTLPISKSLKADEVERIVLEHPETQPYLEGRTVKKVIVVPGRIVNIVLG